MSFVALLLLLVGEGEDALVVGLVGCDEVEKDASQFVGSGGDRLGSSQAGAQAAVEGTEGGVAMVQGLCGHAQSVVDAILASPGLGG